MLAGLWLVLTNGDPSGWGYGLVIVPLVWLISGKLFPPGEYQLRPWHLPRFAVWFLVRSLVAALDVSRRLLARVPAVAPGVREVALTLPAGSPRWVAANILSLMPGTLSVEIRNDTLLLHCLDTGQDVNREVAATEQQVGRLFGITPAGTEAS